MISNYLKTTWRRLFVQRSTVVINLIGLSLGIAAALTIFIVVQYEWHYDRYHSKYDHIYRVVTHTQHESHLDYNAGTQFPLAEALRVDLPELEHIVPIFDVHGQVNVSSRRVHQPDEKFVEQILFTTSDFFDVFDAQWLSGDAKVLDQPNSIVLDRQTATRFFGSWDQAIGQRLTIERGAVVTVAGIVEDTPNNTNFPLHIIGSLATAQNNAHIFHYQKDDWNSTHSTVQIYVSLDPSTSSTRISDQLEQISKKYYKGRGQSTRSLHLQPLRDLHFDTRYGSTFNEKMIQASTLTTLGVVGLFILVMAAINFINLSTAQSLHEGKSIGIRKVLGSSRRQLIEQSLSETAFIVFIAITIALIIAYLAMPQLHHFADVPTDISFPWTTVLPFLVGLGLLMTLLSGLYPALVLSSFNPISSLKSKMDTRETGGVSLRKSLVVLQFALAQLLIMGTLIIIHQMAYIRDVDLGFNKEELYTVNLTPEDPSRPRMEVFKERLLQLPQIKNVSLASDVPSSANKWASNFYFDGITSDDHFTFPAFLKYGDADYFECYGLRFVAGAGYTASDTAQHAVINETMSKKLGLAHAEEALGKSIRIGTDQWLTITGVVQDFTPNSLREETVPIIISTLKSNYYTAGIKLTSGAGKQTLSAIQKTFEQVYPEEYYDAGFLDEKIAQFYAQEEKLSLIFKFFAALAIVIALIGLYGIISFMLQHRVKEIGIRKVLGAGEGSIVLLFSKEFIFAILLAFCVAAPVADFVMTAWLANFTYRIDIGINVFLTVILSTLFLAILTIGIKSLKAALANPVDSLRDE